MDPIDLAGHEMPRVRWHNQKTRVTTWSFMKAAFNTCHFFPLTFLFPPPPQKVIWETLLIWEGHILWPLTKVVWLLPLDTNTFVAESSTLHKSPTSSYVLCKGVKVNHANDHLLRSVEFFFFFPRTASLNSAAPVQSLSNIVTPTVWHVCQVGKLGPVENNVVCLRRQKTKCSCVIFVESHPV